LEEYLKNEKIDAPATSSTINEIKTTMARENQFETKETEEKIEVHPFEEMEAKDIESFTDRHVEKSEITPPSKETIKKTLEEDTDVLRKDFAIKWFDNNKKKVEDAGFLPNGEINDKYKISFVMSHWQDKEKGGWNIGAEMRDIVYKEEFGNKIDKIQVLKSDMAKPNLPPETQFLLLNYLQKKAETEQTKLLELQEKANNGNDSDKALATDKENELKALFSVRKEIAGKVMHEDLDAMAEQVIPANEKEKYFQERSKKIEAYGKTQISEQLLKKEWEKFNQLNARDRKAYREKIGDKKHEISTGDQRAESLDSFRQIMEGNVKAFNRKFDLNTDAFRGLLNRGYKPHEIEPKKSFYFFKSKNKFIIPGPDGISQEMSKEELKNLGLEEAKIYNNKIKRTVDTHLESSWEKKKEELIKNSIEARIKEISQSPEQAEGKIEKLYADARQRIIMEHINSSLEKNPKTKDQIAKIEETFGDKGQKVNIKNILAEVMGADLTTLPNNLEKGNRKKMIDALKDYGVLADLKDFSIVTQEDWIKAKKTHTGIFSLIMKVIEKSLEAKTVSVPKKVKTARKTPLKFINGAGI